MNSRITIVVVIIFVLLGASVAIWYWGIELPAQEAKEKARLEQIAKEQAEQKRKEEAAQKQAQYDQLIASGDAAFDQESWNEAYSFYSDASATLPNQQYPKDQLVLVNEKLDEIAALEAKKAAGFVETLEAPTGRFYVIVSSSFDGDLAMDYASKLAKEGNNVSIIPPKGSNKFFHRVSVGGYDTWDQAVNATSTFSSFANEVWVLKY